MEEVKQDSIKKALKRLVNRLNEYDLNLSIHNVLATCSITCKLRNGNYRKFPFMGGEEFRFSSCYLGKKGSVIYSFKPVYGTAKFQFIELNAHELKEKLPTFDALLREKITSGISVSQYEESYKSFFVEQEKDKKKQQRIQIYGSKWGEF